MQAAPWFIWIRFPFAVPLLFSFFGAAGLFPVIRTALPLFLLLGPFLRRGFGQRGLEFTDKLQVDFNLLRPLPVGSVRRVDKDLFHELIDHGRR